jgi:hypothetical protein
MEHNELMNQAKFLKRQSLGQNWEKTVEDISKEFFPNKNIDLGNYYMDLPYLTSQQDCLLKAFDTMHDDRLKLIELIKIETKKLNILKGISDSTKNNVFNFLEKTIAKIDDSKKIIDWSLNSHQTSTEITINICSLFLENSIPTQLGKKYPYSKTKIYVNRLLGIFEELAEEEPDCKHDRENEAFIGKAYYFLLSSRTALIPLGIRLGTDLTIGKYATESIKKYKKAIADLKLMDISPLL